MIHAIAWIKQTYLPVSASFILKTSCLQWMQLFTEKNKLDWMKDLSIACRKVALSGGTCKIVLDGLRSTQWLWLAMHDNPCLVFDNLFFHRSSYVKRGDAFRMQHTTYAWPRDARTGVATSKSISLKTSKSYENDVCRNCAFRVKTSERKNN